MNLQQVFDKVSNHLLTQNRKSMGGPGGGCAYRGDNGSSCAVGCLMPDSEYHIRMEGQNIQDDQVWDALLTVIDPNCEDDAISKKFDLLADLQELHDDHECYTWAERLNIVASNHGLTFTLPTEGV